MLVMSDRKSFARRRPEGRLDGQPVLERDPAAGHEEDERGERHDAQPAELDEGEDDGWPKPLNAVAVSTTTRPVTQTAEVDVNRASMKEMRPPRALAGSQRSTPPTRTARKKLRARTRAGWKNRCCRVL